jgi:hypothetical protein
VKTDRRLPDLEAGESLSRNISVIGSLGWPELLVIVAIAAFIWWIVAVRRRWARTEFEALERGD